MAITAWLAGANSWYVLRCEGRSQNARPQADGSRIASHPLMGSCVSVHRKPGNSGREDAVHPRPVGDSLLAVMHIRIRKTLVLVQAWAMWRKADRWFQKPISISRGSAILSVVLIGCAAATAIVGSRPSVSHEGGGLRAVTAESRLIANRNSKPSDVSRTSSDPAVRQTTSERPPQAVADDPHLIGIVGHLPGGALALIRDREGTHEVAVGGTAGGWMLVQLSPTDAIFERDGVRRTLDLPDVE